MAVVVCAGLLQVVPIGFKGALIFAGSMVVGLVCAINAFMDRGWVSWRRMLQAFARRNGHPHATHDLLAR